MADAPDTPDDLVDRLRARVPAVGTTPTSNRVLFTEAADRIEVLTATLRDRDAEIDSYHAFLSGPSPQAPEPTPRCEATSEDGSLCERAADHDGLHLITDDHLVDGVPCRHEWTDPSGEPGQCAEVSHFQKPMRVGPNLAVAHDPNLSSDPCILIEQEPTNA